MTQAVALAQQASTGVSPGFRNRIINGAMTIDQRNAGASVATTDTSAAVYTLDRWFYRVLAASKFTIQQDAGAVTPPAGFNDYIGFTSTSAYSSGAGDLFSVGQQIEGFNCADFNWGTANAKTVTLSFWVRSSLTGTFGGALRNSAGDRSYPFSYSISAANTWQQKSVTIAGDTSGTWLVTNGIGISLRFDLGSGATYQQTAGAWFAGSATTCTGATNLVGTNGATLYITGVQLEVGSTATSFDYRPYGTELALCQRYYEKSYPPSTAVPTNAQGGSIVFALGSTTYVGGGGGSTSQGLQTASFKVQKRAVPSVTTYSYVNSTTGVVSNYWTGADLAANTGAIGGADVNGFNIYNASGSNQTVASYAVMCQFAASAEL